jgi:hypothetical protein
VPASAQEQQDLQQTLLKAGQMIHGRASRDAVLNSLHAPNMTVAQAVGQTAAQVLMTVNGQKQAVTKAPLSNDVLQEAARYVIPELVDIGISAGIFPLKPPPGGAATNTDGPGNGKDQGPGVGSDPYNRTIRMAMLEATKVYGEAQLKGPNAQQLTANAQDEWASNVRKEVQNGTADPKYMAMVQPRTQQQQPQQGAPALIPGGSQQGASPPGAPS